MINPLLVIGGLGAVALYVWSQSSSSSNVAAAQNAAASAPPSGFQGAPGQFNATTSPGAPAGTNPGGYPVVPASGGDPTAAVPSGVPAGTPAGTSTTGAPLVHTGWAHAGLGMAWAVDGGGNPYLV